MLHLAPTTPRRHDLSSIESNTGPVHRTRVTAGRTAAAIALTVFAALAGACNKDSTPTSATSTTTTTTSGVTTTEDFTGTVAVGGSLFYSFSVAESGTVSVLYSAAAGNGVPGTVWLGIGLGTPSGEDCVATNTINTPPGTGAQLTGTYTPGIYCAKVSDIGNLYAPASFTVSITHP